MTLFSKLVVFFIALVTVVAIGFSLQIQHYKKELHNAQQSIMNSAFKKQDSCRHAEYDIWISIQEKRLQEFRDSLIKAHDQTTIAKQKASDAHLKSLKAHEERSSIHLHPDSLPLF